MTRARGWCPTAWRPMAAADGLLVRVRPPLARMSVAQATALAAASRRWGNGRIDLTSRAAIQIRGVAECGHADLMTALVDAGLADPHPERDARPQILVDPCWHEGDDTHRIARALAGRLDELPPLPPKIGIAVDCGQHAVLADDPADFRIERGETGGLILRAEDRATGVALDKGGEIDKLVELVRWYVASGGGVVGRMARHRAELPASLVGTARPARGARMAPGPNPLGIAIGLPFGRIDADRLAAFANGRGVVAVRLTPWRLLLLEGDGIAPPAPVDARLLAADACVGAPDCAQATVETRDLAARLAPRVAGSLHVSGCAKGCARPRSASVVLTGRDGAFDLAFDAHAGDPAVERGLSPAHVLDRVRHR